MNRIDPSGEVLIVPIVTGALLGGGIELLMQLISNCGNFDSIDWGEVGIQAAIGGAFGGLARVFGPFNTRGLPKELQRLRKYFRIDRAHHGKGWHFDGSIGKNFDKPFKLVPALSVGGDTVQECDSNKCP